MRNLKFLPLFLTFCLLVTGLCAPSALAVKEPSISAPSAIVVDCRSGSVIYAKNADRKVYPASTTKIMTVLLAVEAIERGELSLEDKVTATQSAMDGLSALGSSANIQVGEVLTLEQLLYCAMVSSANESCNIIAEHVSGTRAAFIQAMNDRAQALGCSSGTHFANAHGLPLLEHYTTAEDFALVALEAARHPLFMEICGASDVIIPATNKSPQRTLHNSNALISSSSIYGSSYLYDGASGMKTGHTTAAGYCLASTASRNGVDLLALVFGASDSSACFRDTAALYDWTFANYSYREVLSASDCLGSVPVLSYGTVDYVELCPVEDIALLLPNDFDDTALDREVTIFTPEDGSALPGPLTPGTVLGKVRFLVNGEDYASVDLVPASSAALVMDRDSGTIIYGKGVDNRVLPADTTKLMTALLAVEAIEAGQVSPTDPVTITDAIHLDLDKDVSLSGLKVGETMTLESLLYCLLLPSGDDAANAVAEYVGGTVPDFVAQMNRRAAELGCVGTSFSNAHGAADTNHYTTARDAAAIAREVTLHPYLTELCSAPTAELPATNLSQARVVRSTNALICADSIYGSSYLYEGATGLKTGYNAAAGYCLVSTATRNGIDLLCCVFGGEKTDAGYSSFNDTIALYNWVFDNYSYQEVLKSTENVASVDIALGSNADYVNIRPSASITALLPNDYDPAQFQKTIRVYALENGETLSAPISAGQVLGEITLTRDGVSFGTVPLVSSASVELSRVQYIKSEISRTLRSRNFVLLAVAVALFFGLYFTWVIVYRMKRRRYLKAARAAAAPHPAPDLPAEPQQPRIFRVREKQPLPPAVPDAPTEVLRPLPDNITELRPAGDGDDLLRGAKLVARLPEDPAAPSAEASQEKAERDYFEEFFRRND